MVCTLWMSSYSEHFVHIAQGGCPCTSVFVSTASLQRINRDWESVLPDALYPFKNWHVWPQEATVPRNRSERRRSQGKGCTHCQSTLSTFTVSFLPLRSEKDEVLQLAFKTEMFSVKSWSSSSSTILKRFFSLCCSFSQPFFILFSKSWLKNVFLTWIDKRETFFCCLNVKPDVSITPCVLQSLVSLLHKTNCGKNTATRNFVLITEIILPMVNSEILWKGVIWANTLTCFREKLSVSLWRHWILH